jgi:succinyl-CoA synthetase beta subunit
LKNRFKGKTKAKDSLRLEANEAGLILPHFSFTYKKVFHYVYRKKISPAEEGDHFSMRLHEYEAKALFRKNGIAVPEGTVARSRKEAEQIGRDLNGPVVVKAQVLAGGRGKAGGIGFAETPSQAGEAAERILGKTIGGERVEAVLVEERLAIARELYAGITIDRSIGHSLLILGLEGGIDVEARAEKNQERFGAIKVDPLRNLMPFETRKLVRSLGFEGDTGVRIAEILYTLNRLFEKYDALMAEINPLILSPQGTVAAADAVFEIDDAALFRQTEFRSLAQDRITDPLAREGRALGVSYVGLEGDIGVICSGAGLGLASVDIISRWGRPANFLETGGGITADLMAGALRLVMKKPGLKGIFINLYGGINPIHQGAEGIARVIREDRITLPIVAKALGNFQEETWRILEEAGVTVIKTIDTEGAVEELFRQVRT